MPSYFVSTDGNMMGDVQVDNATGSLVKMTMYPVAANPDNLPAKSPGGISTQWLVQHPTLPVVCALTSYWNKQAAQLTCFKFSSSQEDVSLTKTTVEGATAGREAVHAAFAPQEQQDNVTLAVAHHNDGVISFFQFPTKELPTSLMDQPILTLELPEVVPGTKHTLATNKGSGLSVPSSHFVQYSAAGDYLWVLDPNQSVIFTYKVDPQTALPVQADPPAFTFHCHTDAPTLGWFSGLVAKFMGLGCRPRRMAVSPNQEYVFISYETRNVIQVYHLNAKTGQIDPDSKGCLQEVSTLDGALVNRPLIGFSFQASAEMLVHGDSLYVSNRGGVLLGSGENSIRIFDIKDGGRLAHNSAYAMECAGPVRHFCVFRQGDVETLVAGTSKPVQSLQTFQRTSSSEKYTLVGSAETGVNVLCVLLASKVKGDNAKADNVTPPATDALAEATIALAESTEALGEETEAKAEEATEATSEAKEAEA